MVFCLHVHAADFILVSILPISFLYLHFSLPCLHRTNSIFFVRSNSDIICASFYGSTFVDFPYSLRIWFSAFNISLFKIFLTKEENKPSQNFLVYLTRYLMFKAYLFAIEFSLSKVQ